MPAPALPGHWMSVNNVLVIFVPSLGKACLREIDRVVGKEQATDIKFGGKADACKNLGEISFRQDPPSRIQIGT